MPDDAKQSAVAFLNAAAAYYESLGVKVARVMTNNAGRYRASAFRDACRIIDTNWHRPHDSLKAKTSISELGLIEDNLSRLHS